jgi:KDO2-lipid IV(A) lauroyltransferase
MAVDLIVVHRRRGQHLDRPPRVQADWKEVGRRMTEWGSVGVCGHVGSWELAAAMLSLHNPGALGVVARRIYFPPFNDLVVGLRRSFGMEIFYPDDSPRPMIGHLRAKKILGILPDQDVKDVSGIFVPFFGADAWTPTGPAALALTTRAPIFVIDLVWDRDRYRLILEGPLPFPNTGSRAGDIRSLTEAWTQRFERIVRTYPDQWAWFHRRWKTRPKDRTPATD